jgi:peptide deformylase
MAILTILQYPDPRLHNTAVPVARIDDSIRRLIRDMTQTMYAAPGVGLAATQVDVHKQIIVIDVSPTHDQLKVFINPQILETRGTADLEEGCLSVPGVYDKIERAQWIRVGAMNEQGEMYELEADGMFAVCIQHEMDHLKGKVFVEYLSRLKRTRILTRMRKLERQAG